MGRIGLVTLTGYGNFGNRLQNYALQEVVKSMGIESVATLKSAQREGQGGRTLSRRLWRLRQDGVPGIVAWLRQRVGRSASTQLSEVTHILHPEQQHAIANFVTTHIDETLADYSTVEAAYELADSYDRFVVGSDQVWHPGFGLRDHLRFLKFAQPSQRVAYSGSFGVPLIPGFLTSEFRSGLMGIPSLSVREDRAAELVATLTGREVPVTLDPTMLLEPGRWRALAQVPPSLRGGEYVAQFLLGSGDEQAADVMSRYAQSRDLEVVDLRTDTRPDLLAMGPLEFIGALKNAELVVTDSFHAAVFSVLFNVPFLLKGRGNMNSRFDTLLSKSGLKMPKWQGLKDIEASIEVDWDTVNNNLVRERASSLGYLQSALSGPQTS